MRNLKKYELALAEAKVATLTLGDTIYIPSLWWHNVRSRGGVCIVANYWWNSPQFKRNDPMMALYHSLFTISHLPG